MLACTVSFIFVLLHTTLSMLRKEIDKGTFEYMWKLAEPEEGATEGCFLRLQQQEFYEEGYGDGAQLKYYPGVSAIARAIIGAQHETVERYIE